MTHGSIFRFLPLLAFPICFLAVSLLLLPTAVEGQPVHVFAWPGGDAGVIVAAAGGHLVGPVQPRIGVLAYGPGPDFIGRLRAAGALAALDPSSLLKLLCGPDA